MIAVHHKIFPIHSIIKCKPDFEISYIKMNFFNLKGCVICFDLKKYQNVNKANRMTWMAKRKPRFVAVGQSKLGKSYHFGEYARFLID